MAINTESIVESVLRGSIKAPTSGMFTPTLVIGLGGTGIKTLRELKSVLSRHETAKVRLLGIDSDSGENQINSDSIPQLDQSEFMLLRQRGV